ncbi:MULTISPECIES: AAA family ATPase [Pseudomonas putida group]|uniref:AAA ATPase n=1 Tax=Pseudomonas putida (strain DOT-T1E) TaxID=1196325 RepID=I7B5F0_PSEPT|nr:AAA family ATPase [Pseudomonas putida]AFO46528.1 AAA ATPase [Pseudomonas putida DOT-T1E]ULL03446.1 AAA family ATPase [Pseudomonas putida]UZM92611.1 AAA family ATPase [Pseudomonas putida DOT-T1E]
MILRELEVSNYRPFRSERFAFSERVTVIAGVNGRGKSAILDGLSLLLSRLLPQVTPARGGYKYLKPQDVHQGEQALKISLSASFEDIPINFTIDYAPAEGMKPGKLLPQIRQEIRRIYGDPQRVGDAAPIAVYYTTDRAAYRLPKRLLTGLPQGQSAAYHGALFNRQIDFRDFMGRYRGWADSIARGEDRDQKNQRTLEMIDRAVQEFLPGFSDVRVGLDPLRLLVSKQGQILDLTQMSDGERSLLAMMIDLCRRLVLANPELDDPLQGTGVVLIDEVELHLHPQWQRGIVEKLRRTFPRMQFILTTHSPFVVQTLRPGELRLLGENLDDEALQDPGEYSNRGLEEVATKVMGIEDPNIVPRYTQMLDAAREYYHLLETAEPGDLQQLDELKARLEELVEPFPDEPAYRAFLEVQRVAAFREGNKKGEGAQ